MFAIMPTAEIKKAAADDVLRTSVEFERSLVNDGMDFGEAARYAHRRILRGKPDPGWELPDYPRNHPLSERAVRVIDPDVLHA